MKRTFFLLCAVLLVAGSLLPLAGYRLATAALGRAAPEAAERKIICRSASSSS